MKNNPAKEVVEAVQILIDNAIKKTTNINGGIITAINSNNKYSVLIKGKTNILPVYPKTTLAVGDKVFIVTPQGEPNRAFILPNTINKIIDNNIDITSTSTSDIYGNGFYINDVNNKEICHIQAVSLSTGYDGIEIATVKTINGTQYKNSVDLLIDKSGTKKIIISDPSEWKTALGI